MAAIGLGNKQFSIKKAKEKDEAHFSPNISEDESPKNINQTPNIRKNKPAKIITGLRGYDSE